ncbi:MAG: cell filamentation protein Fic [Desulfuromonadales bacterium C00003096]|jgi:cell filamentation protein|nr:MAG: cell filamentation protein Fic [Desulfuromonadales bacterium C00003096]
MSPGDRYDTTDLPEGQFEPGSNDRVLKNLIKITTWEEMQIAETEALWATESRLLEEVEQDQSFTVQDICNMHRLWLGQIYAWARRYRQVNISRNDFNFAMARTIPVLMASFEQEQLRRYTPCLFDTRDEIVQALAEVHVELMLIHPFREGNGCLGRLLATLMGLQAGLPPLDFSIVAGEFKEDYFRAVRAGMDRDYQPMQLLFAEVIERSF